MIDSKVSVSKGSAAARKKILERQESSSHDEDNPQMTAAKGAQPLTLNSEIANSITETKSKDRERNNNKNQEFFREADKELDPRGIDPGGRKMLVNPLRTADQVNR